ncbi:MAG: methyltransferase domain-containing protein [Dehalococcoidia bacterium]|nr:methyltransferase domain-containing protein [Dehalococcoidia bacterium]
MAVHVPACPSCGCTSSRTWAPGSVSLPVASNMLCFDAAAARQVPRGELVLLFCGSCSLTWNGAFEEERLDYVPGYENSLHHSPAFSRYAAALARALVATFDLERGLAVEVGCGRGDFLRELVGAGCARAVGFDPSLPGIRIEDRLELYDRRAGVTDIEGARLVLARHVLEHVSDPVTFVTTLSSTGAGMYLEVPRAEYMFDAGSFWDLVYEHVTYFSAPALRALTRKVGYRVRELRPSFGGQFLSLFAVPGTTHRPAGPRHAGEVARLAAQFDAFGAAFATTVAHWSAQLTRMAEAGPVVAWGAGSKGATFLNLVPGSDLVAACVDVNPLKQGCYVPGTGHAIFAPAELASIKPSTVLVMNPNYLDEIAAVLRQSGLTPRLVPVLDGPGQAALAG